MPEEPLTAISDPHKVNSLVAWLGLADKDYIASRTLLRQGLLVQGAVLASTAIEKYLKTTCQIRNIPFKTQGEKAHDLSSLYTSIKAVDSRKDLNESFLKLLGRAYKLRYPDRLEEEYNLALHQAKMLTGLDETVFKIRSRIQFVGEKVPQALEEKGEIVLQGNHAFGKAKKEDLFRDPLLWFEMRVLKNKVWMEATYVAKAEDDGKYDLEGFRHGSSDREFLLQAAPIGQSDQTQAGPDK